MEEWQLNSASKEDLEVLEWFGDAILEELTQRILILQSTKMGVSLSPRLFNVLRDAFLTNTNLSYVYDRRFKKGKERMSIKRRADRVEAYFGYLYVRFDSETSKKRKTIVRKKMDSLLSNIMNICDLSLAAEDSSRVSSSTNQFQVLDDLDGTVLLEETHHDDVGQILREKEWEESEIEKDESSRLLENLLFLLKEEDEERERREEDNVFDDDERHVETETSEKETSSKETLITPHLAVLVRYGRKLLSEKVSRYLFFKNLNKKTCPDSLTRTRQEMLSTKRVAELADRLISSTSSSETERDRASILFRVVAQSSLRNESELIERVTRELLQRNVTFKTHFRNINNMFPRAVLCCSQVLKCYCSEWSMRSEEKSTTEEHRIGISLAPLEIVVSSSSSSSQRKRPRKRRRRRKKKRTKIDEVSEKEDNITICLAHFNRCEHRGEILRLATSSTFRNLEILMLLLHSWNLSMKTMQDLVARALSDITTDETTIQSQVLKRLSNISIGESCKDWIEFKLQDPMECRMLKVLCSAHGAPIVLKADETIRIVLTRRDGERISCIGATSLIRFVVEAIVI